MIFIPISPLPNQVFTVNIDEDFYELDFKLNLNVMCVSITRNDKLLVSNYICVAGEGLIPFSYMRTGNFVITTTDGELPDYTQFGVSQFLYYLTAKEIAEFNNG